MAVKETFQKSVVAQLEKTNKSKWGVEESLGVILDLFVDETGASEIRDNKELVEAIREVVNPSQFAQKLENADDPANKGQKMLKRNGRAAKVKNALLDFGVK